MGVAIRILKDFAANGQGYSNFLRPVVRIWPAGPVCDLRQPSASASWRGSRTPSASNIPESGTGESRAIPSARGRCADSLGRSSCRSPAGSSRSGRMSRGRSQRSREPQGRRGRPGCPFLTVALVAGALADSLQRPRNLRNFFREHPRHHRRGTASIRGRRPRLPRPRLPNGIHFKSESSDKLTKASRDYS